MKLNRRQLIRFLLILSGLVVATLALSPWWIPIAARPVAERFGVQWESVDTRGWSAFAIRGIRVETPGAVIRLDELQLPQPMPWLFYRAGWTSEPRLEGGHLEVAIVETGESPGSEEPGSGIALLQDIRRHVRQASPWIPPTRLESLAVLNADGSSIIHLDNLHLEGNRITGDFPGQRNVPAARLALMLEESALILSGSSLDFDPPLALNLELRADPQGQSRLQGVLSVDNAPAELTALFATGEWVPQSMRVSATAWPVPGALVEQAGLVGTSLQAQFDLEWRKPNYSLSLQLESENLFDRYLEEATRADIQVSGDMEHFEVSRLLIQSGWLDCRLSDPVRFLYAEKRFAGEARLDLRADLDQLENIPASGQVLARATLQPDFRDNSVIQFSLRGENLVLQEQEIETAAAAGRLAWPVLTIDRIELRAPGTGHFLANGSYSFADQSMAGGGAFGVAAERILEAVPKMREMGPLEGEMTFQGTLESFRHQGRIRPVNLRMEGWHTISASGSWQGTGLESAQMNLKLSSDQASEAELELQIQREAGSGILNLRFADVILVDPEFGTLLTEQPFDMVIDPGKSPTLRSLSGLRLGGQDMYLELDYSTSPVSLAIQGRNLEADPLQGWIDQPVPNLVLESVDARIEQLEPFVQGRFALRLREPFEDAQEMTFELNGNLGPNGIEIKSVDSRLGEHPLVRGELFIPVRIHALPESEEQGYYSPISGSRLEGSLQADISRELAGEFPEVPYLDSFPAVHLDIHTSGTPANPEVTISGNLANLGVLHALDERLKEYPFENIEFALHLSRERIKLQRFRAGLKEAQIEISGDLPVSGVRRYIGDSSADWRALAREGRLDVQFRNFRSEGFASILPGYMRPTGLVDGELTIRPGMDLSGEVRVREFSLRPTLYSQMITGITAKLKLDQSRMVIQEAGATIGRSRFSVSGFIDLASLQDPTFDVKLYGERLSLLRTPDMILFGDVDLDLKSATAEDPASLAGTIRIRDSLLLLDLDPLAAQTAGRGLPKPPFFEVGQEPFQDWALDIEVTGRDCLRFKSAYAKALLSVQVHLAGTLGSPVWVGSIFSSEGTVDFPGFRTSLSRSEIFVTRERQDQLQLDINSIGQVASYVISMNLAGTTDNPQLTFASTPELSNTQILRLLATGSTNRSGVGSVGLYIGKGFLSPSSDESLWDRLTIEIGRDVTESSKETIDLYYDLTERLRLHGEYDKYDAHNVNLEWEVFSR